MNTEGNLELEGEVIDAYTQEKIAGRNIIIQGLVMVNKKLVPIEAGHLLTDSSGRFSFSLNKVKNAYHYNFCLVGDSDYTSANNKISLYNLKRDSKFLSFSLDKMVDLSLRIERKSNNRDYDTLRLDWKSNEVPYWELYPYTVYNSGNTNYNGSFATTRNLKWIGGNINATVKTRVFADKITTLHWQLKRKGKIQEITDTIICRRDFMNVVYFTY